MCNHHIMKRKKVKVKREPVDIKPLSEYVDDRLELIKQTFACLKPKTIQRLTKLGLPKESLEVIQEKCLDEVLGISKKRLLSIINDTKCPSDTESSDDEDCERVIEHISLDEISSDEDSKATRNKRTSNGQKSREKSKAAQPVKDEPKPAEEKKEYSVLELLELQARARAIRSQLAQEPVTKIELDDDEEDKPSKVVDDKSSKKKVSDKKNDAKSSSKKDSNGSPSKLKRSASNESQPISSKVVKLKRNIRKGSPEASKKAEVKVEKEKSRESSPEVMPITASPVTLCISSDEDEKAARDKVVRSKSPLEEGEIDLGVSKTIVEEKCTEKAAADNDNVADIKVDSSKVKSTEQPSNSSSPPKEEKQDDVLSVQLDDDCIELQCDDEPLEEEEADVITAKEPEEETLEIMDSSAGEEEQDEKDGGSSESKSWGERWLESSKVTKILATSKLGNQVRRKIQLSKKNKEKEPKVDEPKETDKESDLASTSTAQESIAELGSIAHYKKIAGNGKSSSD